jgi:putative peptide zinc metalloprotease protein
MKIAPKRLSTKTQGELRTRQDPVTGTERPMNPSYQARVPVDDTEGVLLPGLRGRAKIHTPGQTLARRFWRLITRTFNFKL